MTGTGAYLAVLLLMTLTFIGIPAVGPAIVGWPAGRASAGQAGGDDDDAPGLSPGRGDVPGGPGGEVAVALRCR